MQELLEYAALSQDEVCGLILDGDRLFRCRNTHSDPGKHFRVSMMTGWQLRRQER